MPEEAVHDVVEDADLEDAEKLRVAVVAGELEPVVEIRRDAGNEPEDPDQEEDDSHQPGDVLNGCPIHDHPPSVNVAEPCSARLARFLPCFAASG